VLPQHNVVLQYVKHGDAESRPSDSLFDIGAFEFGSGGGGPVNQAPVAVFTATPESGIVPLTVTFSATGSYDPDGSIAAYAWQFGNGATATGVAPTHTYQSVGTFTVTLQVTDNQGATASTSRTITVNPLPAPVLSGTVSGSIISLSWTDSSGGKATGYRVDRRQQGGSWTFVANVTSRSFSQSRPRGRWEYRVRSFNASGNSPYSNVVSLRVR
jgi:PKD repeat protein